MDDIFQKLQDAKKSKVISNTNESKEEIISPVQSFKPSKKDNFNDSRGIQSVKRTEEGYRIYTAKELNIGKGGDSELCPFDCSCCY